MRSPLHFYILKDFSILQYYPKVQQYRDLPALIFRYSAVSDPFQ